MSVAAEHISSVFEKLERDLVKLSSKQTAPSVHNFRIGASRVQTLFQQLLPESDRNQKKLLKMFSRMRKRAGKIRDLDVQLAALRSLKVSQEPRRKTHLMNTLIELRTEHEKKLRKVLTKDEVREIRKRLRRAHKDLRVDQIRDPLKTARQMLAQVARPQGAPTAEQLHRYRIVTKRARYVAEFAPKSAEAEEVMAQLKRAQDALGDWHDWLTLEHTAAQRLGDVHESSLVAVLHNLAGSKFRRAVSTLPMASPAEAPAAKRMARHSVPASADEKYSGNVASSAA
jgi:CHAD domain-containing protein